MTCFKSTHLLIGEYFKNTMKQRENCRYQILYMLHLNVCSMLYIYGNFFTYDNLCISAKYVSLYRTFLCDTGKYKL